MFGLRRRGECTEARRVALIVLLMGMMALAGCSSDGESHSIDLDALPEQSSISATPEGEADSLVFAVAAVNSPRSTLDAYQDLARYLGERVGMASKLVGSKTYAEINSLVRSGDATLAIVCTGAYVFAQAEFGMELLAAPVIGGEQVYRSYLIVNEDSALNGWEDLRGKTFAFTDPLSNSGRLVPLYQIWLMGRTPESLFSRYIFTYSHDNSIKAVARGLVDAASVDSLVYDYAMATGEDDASDTRIVWRSPPYAINPVVVNPRLDADLKARLRELLLEMDQDPEGQKILRRLRFDRFAPAEDSSYDSTREIVRATGIGSLP